MKCKIIAELLIVDTALREIHNIVEFWGGRALQNVSSHGIFPEFALKERAILNEGDTWFRLGNEVLEVGMSGPCLRSSLAQIHIQLGKIETVCFYLLCARFLSDVISRHPCKVDRLALIYRQ